MGKTVECKCKECGEWFTARVADRKRGWGKFCSKSCKAKKQTKRHKAIRRGGQIINRKAWLEAKAERNPEALTSDELIELGATQAEVDIALFDESLEYASTEHGQDGTSLFY